MPGYGEEFNGGWGERKNREDMGGMGKPFNRLRTRLVCPCFGKYPAASTTTDKQVNAYGISNFIRIRATDDGGNRMGMTGTVN